MVGGLVGGLGHERGFLEADPSRRAGDPGGYGVRADSMPAVYDVAHHLLDVHVGAQAVVAIPWLDIELQAHRRPCNQAAVGSLGFGAEGFNPL
jgi:hypothetical protein